MNQIKFSHDYEKLPFYIDGKTAKLLFIYKIELSQQTQAFIDYDTKIRNKNKYYQLPLSGAYMLLLFEHNGTIFSTLRSYTSEKFNYYKNLINKELDVRFVL